MYPCQKCDKIFSRKNNLNRHEKFSCKENSLKRKLSSETCKKHPKESTKEKTDKVMLANDIINGILKGPPMGVVDGKKLDNNNSKISNLQSNG